jgi:hypothetical protein
VNYEECWIERRDGVQMHTVVAPMKELRVLVAASLTRAHRSCTLRIPVIAPSGDYGRLARERLATVVGPSPAT